MKRGAIAVAVFACASAQAQDPKQVVKPPIAVYWMSVETAAGVSMPGMSGLGSMMGSMMGGGAQQGGRNMLLQLGSQRTSASPAAEHVIPPGLNMGPSLPLLTPVRERPQRGPRPDGTPGEMPEIKGRMLVYWGCGEEVRRGQPIVLDYAKMSQGQAPAIASRRVAGPTPPAFGRNRTYGDWPNPDNSKEVPRNASLRGEHVVKGNYAPEMRFSLGETHDFLEPVALSAAGGGKFQWRTVPHATGYFAMLYGAASQDETVMWSSSEVQEMGSSLVDYVPPAEVARLVREKVIMPPSQTDCTVPAEVVKRAGGAPYLTFVAYGPEANFIHPPRPADPKVAWEQEWFVKARFKSTGALMLGDAAAAAQGPRDAPSSPPPSQGEASQSSQQRSSSPSVPNPVDEGIKALRGIFGR